MLQIFFYLVNAAFGIHGDYTYVEHALSRMDLMPSTQMFLQHTVLTDNDIMRFAVEFKTISGMFLALFVNFLIVVALTTYTV